MMSPAPAPPSSIQVELWENERRWVGGGFSKKGLLPGERGPYSTDDGSISWRTLEDAGASLLGKGWVWTKGSEFSWEKTDNDCDQDGWSYAIDFSPAHLQKACATQGLAHFVRRRRICRSKTFDMTQFVTNDDKCQNCDSEAVDALSAKLLEALSTATLLQRDANHHLPDSVAFSLKANLIDTLEIGSPMPQASLKLDPQASLKLDPPTRLHQLLRELSTFGHKQQNLTQSITQMFKSNEPPQGLSERSALVSARFFGPDEREAVACIVIRQLDPECVLHCGRDPCSDVDCEYFRVECPNRGCGQKVSRKHLSHHANDTCAFKVMDCPNGCGESFPRNQRETHLTQSCALRQVPCPFESMGCTAVVMARDRPQHVDANTNSHLLMVAKQMEVYETRLNEMSKRMSLLEKENAILKQQLSTSTDKLGKEVSGVDKHIKTVSKQLTALERKCNSAFRSHVK